MSGGIIDVPVILRISVGAKYGAQHSQDWTSFISHVPGLKAVFPVTPYDAKGLMNAALNGTDPVVFFESQAIYDKGEEFETDGVPEGYYEIPLGETAMRREGNDITLISIGSAVYKILEVADQLQNTYGMSADVIDGIFVRIAEDSSINSYGWEIYKRFYKAFLPSEPNFVIPAGKGDTFFVAALSAATGNDLKLIFRDWNFPIDENYYSEIHPILQSMVNQ